MTGEIWIMACGTLGLRLAKLYQQEAIPVFGWVRTHAALDAARLQGVRVRSGKFDASCYVPFYTRENVNVFWLAPPPARGQQDIRLQRFLTAAGGAIQRLVLLSHAGESVAKTARQHRWQDAECVAQQWGQQQGRRLAILRLPGAYACSLPVERVALACKELMDGVLSAGIHTLMC